MMTAGKAPFGGIHGFADDDTRLAGTMVEGFPVLGTVKQLLRQFGRDLLSFHCAIGCNRRRKEIAELLEAQGWQPVSLTDPSAIVAETARVGLGVYIGPLSVIAPHGEIGRHVLVNVGTSIGHHSHCADFSQVCPGVRLSGHAQLGEGAFVGSNGVVTPGVSVAEWATVGAASLVVRDVPPGATALGVPARILPVPAPRLGSIL
jgi:acetyltransferase EpsM